MRDWKQSREEVVDDVAKFLVYMKFELLSWAHINDELMRFLSFAHEAIFKFVGVRKSDILTSSLLCVASWTSAI